MKTQFTVKISYFNERQGPVCLNLEQNQEWKRICIDAMGVEKQNFTFEEGIQIYRILNVEIPNPSARGQKDRYSIIITYEKGLGSLKTEICEKLRFEFVELINKVQNSPPDITLIEKFCKNWERDLSKFKNITDIVEIKNEISSRNQYRNLLQLSGKGKISIFLLLLGTAFAIGITLFLGQTNDSTGGFSPIIYIILGTVVLLGIFVAVKTRRALK